MQRGANETHPKPVRGFTKDSAPFETSRGMGRRDLYQSRRQCGERPSSCIHGSDLLTSAPGPHSHGRRGRRPCTSRRVACGRRGMHGSPYIEGYWPWRLPFPLARPENEKSGNGRQQMGFLCHPLSAAMVPTRLGDPRSRAGSICYDPLGSSRRNRLANVYEMRVLAFLPRVFCRNHVWWKLSACHDVLYFHQRRDELRAYRDTGIGIDPLLSVLMSARYVCFTDPRDRIFAFSDLAQHVRRWSGHPDDHKSPFSPLIIEPNYTKSKEDVYTDLARQYLQKRGVEILQCIRHTEHTLLDNNVPSWAPRWDGGMSHADVGWGSPGPLLPEPPPSLVAARPSYLGDFMDEKILVARGVIFDKVTGSQLRFNPEEPSRYSQIDVFAFWRAMLSRKRGEAFDTYDLASKFLETLATGRFVGDRVEEWAARDQYCTFLTRWAEGTEGLQGDVEPEQLATPIQNTINLRCWGQCLFWTSRGYFGHGPYLAQEGDVLCIIFGCPTPFLLRPIGKRTRVGCSLYRLVGQIYISGARRVRHSSGIGSYFPIFGSEGNKDWVQWGLQQEDIHIC